MTQKELTSLGIDASVTATGLVLLRERPNAPAPETLHAAEIKPSSKLVGLQRQQEIVLNLMEFIHEHKPDRIVVEGYSLGKNMNSTVPLVELGGLLRVMLMIDEIPWFDPRASELKKFVTGAGNAPKDLMLMHVFKRWGFEAKTNNIADAYGLACMGLAQANRLKQATQDMRKIAGAMVLRRS